MSRGHWGYKLASGIAVLLLSCSLSWSQETGPVVSPSEGQRETATEAENAVEAPTAIDHPASAAPRQEESESRYPYPHCEFYAVEECDLVAQQIMAEATVSMKRASWVAAFLTLVGVFLIWLTMQYTAEAAKQTKIAADHTKGMLDEAKKTNAAFIAVEGANIRVVPSGAGFHPGAGTLTGGIKIETLGKNSAANTEARIYFGPKIDFESEPQHIIGRKSGGSFTIPIDYEGREFFVFGVVEYQGIFSNDTRRTYFGGLLSPIDINHPLNREHRERPHKFTGRYTHIVRVLAPPDIPESD